MNEPTLVPNAFHSAWEVLLLFLIPIGGGIPGGVLLAKARGLTWPIMTVLYFISDVILAFAFEPVMKLLIAAGRKSPFWGHVSAALKKSVQKSSAHFGTKAGPLGLILIAFGADPMTGRAAAKAAGHGFVSGWAIAICGDMFYFWVLMASTLWLQSILGDGTWTMTIIIVAMIVVPYIVKWVRKQRLGSATL